MLHKFWSTRYIFCCISSIYKLYFTTQLKKSLSSLIVQEGRKAILILEQTFSLTALNTMLHLLESNSWPLDYAVREENRMRFFRKAMSLSRCVHFCFSFQAYRNVITCKNGKTTKTYCQSKRNTVENVATILVYVCTIFCFNSTIYAHSKMIFFHNDCLLSAVLWVAIKQTGTLLFSFWDERFSMLLKFCSALQGALMTTKLLTINYVNLEPLSEQINQYNLLTHTVYM